jgi:hypothetical protein
MKDLRGRWVGKNSTIKQTSGIGFRSRDGSKIDIWEETITCKAFFVAQLIMSKAP